MTCAKYKNITINVPLNSARTVTWVGMSWSDFASVNEDLSISQAWVVSCIAIAKFPRTVRYCETSWWFPSCLWVSFRPVANRVLHPQQFVWYRFDQNWTNIINKGNEGWINAKNEKFRKLHTVLLADSAASFVEYQRQRGLMSSLAHPHRCPLPGK